MAALDLPLHELERYRGSTPRPNDFDQYWDEALRELDETPEETRIEEAPFPSRAAHAHDLFFTGVRGARIHAKLLRPRELSAPAPAVVMFHGYGGNSGDWADKLAFVSEGFVVAAMDVRGQGGSSTDAGGHAGTTMYGQFLRGTTDRSDNLLLRQIYLDCVRVTRIVARLPEVDSTRISVTGSSQGGGLALACAALEPSVARAASQFPFLCDWRRLWELDLAGRVPHGGLRAHFRSFDPLHEDEDAFFTALGYVDVQHLAPRIRAKVLMATGLLDDACPPSTQFAAYNKIVAPKRMLVYPDFGHEHPYPGWPDSVFGFLREVG